MSSFRRRFRMSLALSRSRLVQRIPDGSHGCVRYLFPGRAARVAPGVCRNGLQTRNLSNTVKYSSISDTPAASIEEIRLKSEFEANKDIRDYLVKWQERNPNILDPVRGLGTWTSSDGSPLPWKGNMLNDSREAHDAGSESLRSTEQDLADFENIGDEGGNMHDYLEPGDLVALTSPEGNMMFAIYVRSVHKQQQFYTQRGKWRIGFHKDLDYVIKGFTLPENVAPLLPYFPDTLAELSSEMQSNIEGGVPRQLGGDLLRQMLSFSEQVLEFYRLNAPRLDNIHETVADEEERLDYGIEELACKALDMEKSQLNDVILFAIHRAAIRQSFLIQDDRSNIFTDHYLVQPKRVTKVLDTVTKWVHEHQQMLVRATGTKEVAGLRNHPMEQFLQKARRLIQLSRKVRSPTKMANVGPTSHRYEPGKDGRYRSYREVSMESFTPGDRMIIEYLQLWAIPPRRMSLSSLRSSGSHIMRATGMYAGVEASAASAPLMLQELGVVYPWENLRLLDLGLRLPGHGVSPASDTMWEQVQKESDKLVSEGLLVDSMQGMRTDWGDLPIYCVDDVDAKEIDDGISLERVPNEDGVFWIRVHVANPTAFISHDSIIMKYAASRNQTLYAPEHTYPMLPPSLTESQFSLGPGRPTLTFSAKMNRQGEVLETDIHNGTARNVIYITHAKLRSLFETETDAPPPLTVGGIFTQNNTREGLTETLSPEDKENFSILRELMLGFREHRRQNGAMEFPSSPDSSVSVTVGPTPMRVYNMGYTHRGRYILGDPIIQIRPQGANPHEVPDMSKCNLVSLVMNLGCWVSGKWCADRNIPAVYDGTWYHPEYAQLTNRNMGKYGGVSFLQLAPPKGISSSAPLHHMPLGLEAYVKSTSPLRRYTDVIAHYQIEAALRSAGTPTPTEPITNTTLPHTHTDIETYLTTTQWKRARIREVSNTSKQHWACMLLFRAFYFAECPLPDTFTCILHKPYTQTSLAGTQFAQGFAGTISSLGVRCQVVFPDASSSGSEGELAGEDQDFLGKGGDKAIMSLVEARITAVDLGRLVVVMEGVRVLKRFERVGEWK